jgi:hypothetical protein
MISAQHLRVLEERGRVIVSFIHGTASVPVTMIGCRQTPESGGGDKDRRLDSRGLIFVYEGPWLRSRRDP